VDKAEAKYVIVTATLVPVFVKTWIESQALPKLISTVPDTVVAVPTLVVPE
jgi:hypothetical protein